MILSITNLSKKLEAIIKQNEDKWDELVQLLLDFRNTIEQQREEKAEELGYTMQIGISWNINCRLQTLWY